MDNFSDIKYVCIDDFALKKRQRYGTVMVDLETHKIVDMIESREMSDVSHWLSNYPNICVVSRDGSLTYASAINESHPEAMQVSDRFHIIKNLTERATLALQKLFQGRIQIPMTSGTYSIRYEAFIGSAIDRIKLVKRLSSEGRTQSEIHQITELRHKIVKQYINMSECDYPEEKQTVREREHNEAVRKLTERSNKVKLLQEEGLGIFLFAEVGCDFIK